MFEFVCVINDILVCLSLSLLNSQCFTHLISSDLVVSVPLRRWLPLSNCTYDLMTINICRWIVRRKEILDNIDPVVGNHECRKLRAMVFMIIKSNTKARSCLSRIPINCVTADAFVPQVLSFSEVTDPIRHMDSSLQYCLSLSSNTSKDKTKWKLAICKYKLVEYNLIY